MSKHQNFKENNTSMSEMQKLNLAAVILNHRYTDETFLTPIKMKSSFYNLYATFSERRENKIIQSLIDDNIFKTCEGGVVIEKTMLETDILYDLINPKVKESNLNELIEIFNEEIRFQGLRLIERAFMLPSFEMLFGAHSGTGLWDEDYVLWIDKLSETVAKIGKLFEKLISRDINNSDAPLDFVKEQMYMKYLGFQSICDEIKKYLKAEGIIEESTYTLLLNRVIGYDFKF